MAPTDPPQTLHAPLAKLRPHLRTALTGLPLEVQDAVIAQMSLDLPTAPPPPTEADLRGFDPVIGLSDTWYVFHEDDMKFLKEAGLVVVGICATNLTTTVFYGILANLVVLLYTYRCKRFSLDGRQALVLRTLKKGGPKGLTPAEVADHLPGDKLMTPQQVEETLTALAEISREDGVPSPIARELKGRWFAVDV